MIIGPIPNPPRSPSLLGTVPVVRPPKRKPAPTDYSSAPAAGAAAGAGLGFGGE